MSFFQALWINPILFASLLASLLASVASGIVGSYVVIRRIVFIAGAISHAILGGIGAALYLQRVYGWVQVTPLIGALFAAIVSALFIGVIHLWYREREDSLISAIWSLGMSLGLVLISVTPGSNLELNNFLIGNLLWVTDQDLLFLFLLDVGILALCLTMHHRFVALCFDAEQARLQGVWVQTLYLLLLILVAITVVLLVQSVGIILVLTILTIPPALANVLTANLSKMMVLAMIWAMVFSMVGMYLSYEMDLPPGALIGLLSSLSYLVVRGGLRGIRCFS